MCCHLCATLKVSKFFMICLISFKSKFELSLRQFILKVRNTLEENSFYQKCEVLKCQWLEYIWVTILHILQLQSKEETIPNDYTHRNTPSIITLGGRQRFTGVSDENQRNLNVKNTVSYFKTFLGRCYKDESV